MKEANDFYGGVFRAQPNELGVITTAGIPRTTLRVERAFVTITMSRWKQKSE